MSSSEKITEKSETSFFWVVEVRVSDGSSFVTHFLGTESEAKNYIDSASNEFEITMRNTSQDIPIVISNDE